MADILGNNAARDDAIICIGLTFIVLITSGVTVFLIM